MSSREEAGDFTNEMYSAVVEECALCELPGGTTDLLADGPVRTDVGLNVPVGGWLAETAE